MPLPEDEPLLLAEEPPAGLNADFRVVPHRAAQVDLLGRRQRARRGTRAGADRGTAQRADRAAQRTHRRTRRGTGRCAATHAVAGVRAAGCHQQPEGRGAQKSGLHVVAPRHSDAVGAATAPRPCRCPMSGQRQR
jgi:hypothetical protein